MFKKNMIYLRYISDSKKRGEREMAEMENSKDLISVLWSGADILRSKMDAMNIKTIFWELFSINICQILFLLKYMI